VKRENDYRNKSLENLVEKGVVV